MHTEKKLKKNLQSIVGKFENTFTDEELEMESKKYFEFDESGNPSNPPKTLTFPMAHVFDPADYVEMNGIRNALAGVEYMKQVFSLPGGEAAMKKGELMFTWMGTDQTKGEIVINHTTEIEPVVTLTLP